MKTWFPVCYSKLIIQGVNNMSGQLNIFYKIYDRAKKLGAKVGYWPQISILTHIQ